MLRLRAGGYETVALEQFRAFHAGEPVDVPARPLLLTFDDALISSFDGADRLLRDLGWTAVMFVDAGAVAAATPGYASWRRLADAQHSGRWEMQLHSGVGHRNIDHGAGTGPFYAYREAGEPLGTWWRRVRRDVEWGDGQLRAHVPGYRPLAYAPPYGNFGQLSTTDPRIPERLAPGSGAGSASCWCRNPRAMRLRATPWCRGCRSRAG